jgi:hypothetical protein
LYRIIDNRIGPKTLIWIEFAVLRSTAKASASHGPIRWNHGHDLAGGHDSRCYRAHDDIAPGSGDEYSSEAPCRTSGGLMENRDV